MKKVLSIILTVSFLVSLLAACGANNASKTTVAPTTAATSAASSASTTEAQKEHKTIVLSTISGYYATGLKNAAEDYTKLHPETTVNIETIADNTAYSTNWTSKMVAGGTDAPDIVHVNLIGDPVENIKKGWLAKLNDFAQEPNEYNGGKTVFDGINKDYLSYAYTTEGDVYFLPFDLCGAAFYYNKDIFDKLGLQEPKTWEDLFKVCDTIKQAGLIPMAMSIGYEGFIRSSLNDWFAKSLYSQLLILPGDARYNENLDKQNTKVTYSPDNPNFDVGAVYDPEKTISTIKNKVLDLQGQAEQKMWTTLKTLSKYYEPGYQTATDDSIYSLFLSQKAAIYFQGSWQVGTILADEKKLGDKAFKWATFKIPSYATPDPNFQGDPRGFLVPGHRLGITNKTDTDQMARAEDFLKFIYSTDEAQKIFTDTLQAGEFVQGPSLVNGVALPDMFNNYLKGFQVSGNKGWILDYETVLDPNQAAEWNQNQFDFYGGKKTIKQFLAAKEKLVDKYLDAQIAKNKYDLNPKTNP